MFQSFIGKAISFLCRQFEFVFPDRVIFPCMGNDDSICGDYRISPLGEFLKLFTRTRQPVMSRLSGTESAAFSRTFPLGGYYSATVPGQAGLRLITLNNIFMSRNYLNACHRVAGDTVQAQLDWPAWELYDCTARNQKAWIVCHEPLGVDMFGVIHGKSEDCAKNVKDFVKEEFAEALQRIFLKWQDTIKGRDNRGTVSSPGKRTQKHRRHPQLHSPYDSTRTTCRACPTTNTQFEPCYRLGRKKQVPFCFSPVVKRRLGYPTCKKCRP